LIPVVLRDVLGLTCPAESSDVHLRETMLWLCRAQDAADGGGVARSYSLRFKAEHARRGWLPAYPETTGYIIPTFCDYAVLSGDNDFQQRAVRMARWETEIQMGNGAVQGGVIGFPPTPAVFNTGQVLFGWARAFRETGNETFKQSTKRAAEFLLDAQDADGAWRRGGSKYARPGVNLYDARTAWGLIEASEVTGDDRFRVAAVKNLDFALMRQHSNGWFADCCLDDDAHPLLHTIAYTMEGLLEAGALLRESRYVAAARNAADALLNQQRLDGSLSGRFDTQWRSASRWSCLTGDAQTAIVWLRLRELTGDERYRDAARRMIRFLKTTHDLKNSDPGIRGGIKGSHPIWGDYGAYDYLNWGAKFFADALMLEARIG
jgi:hypothetical protein